ncbi:MAG: MBL fold metallo-hydrolase [Planctomycetota bacterium]
MNVKTFILGPIQTSCYVAYENGNAIIVDAGGDPADMVKFIKQHGLEPAYLVNTHGHIDHILGNPQLKKSFPKIEICIHKADARMLAESRSNLATELGFEFSSPDADKFIDEGDTLALGGKNGPAFEVLHLPGHTKGGIGLLYRPSSAVPKLRSGERQPAKGTPVLFSGDALFAGSIGRADFPGGSLSELVGNIREKVLTLPDSTLVYPGHGPATTVGDEKHSNPWLS